MALGLTRDPASSEPVEAPTGRGPSRRVLVVYSEGPSCAAALREGAELAASGAQLTVVSLVPLSKSAKCCKGNGAGPYNCAIQEVAQEELAEARRILGSLAERTHFTTLSGMPRPPLSEWIHEQGFDTVIVPKDRFSFGGGRVARELRAADVAGLRLAS